MNPESFISINVLGIKDFSLSTGDTVMSEVCDFFKSSLIFISKMYGESHVFTEPQLIFVAGKNEFTMRIGIRNKEEFEIRKKA